MNASERAQKDKQASENYYKLIEEWKQFEAHVNLKEEQTKYIFSKMNLLNTNCVAANSTNTKTTTVKTETKEKDQEIPSYVKKKEKSPKSFFGNFSSLKSNKTPAMPILDNNTPLVRQVSNSSNEV